ncbi:hypothetical protein C2G38_2225312 [Gigaspora rosea]|uniref:Uncharacterized protein n=1 Tax=Gigaspora rosea TaxID=44941 RepID=A0A397TZD3_9GLOM|nr:hypothetical protein C2G38_2225312 [Gigaspora rosea]
MAIEIGNEFVPKVMYYLHSRQRIRFRSFILKVFLKLGTLPVVLGYHLEWELSSEIVSYYTDKFKEPEKQKPIWQVPSGEVARLSMVLVKRILVVTDRKTGRARAPRQRGLPTWPPESYLRKRSCVIEA